jgi:hypothetical protein
VKQKLNFGEDLYLRGNCGEGSWLVYPANGADPIRGESLGNWDKAIKLECVGEDTWTIPIRLINIDRIKQLAFKFLIDDRWEEGENHNLLDLLYLIQKSRSSSSSSRSSFAAGTPFSGYRSPFDSGSSGATSSSSRPSFAAGTPFSGYRSPFDSGSSGDTSSSSRPSFAAGTPFSGYRSPFGSTSTGPSRNSYQKTSVPNSVTYSVENELKNALESVLGTSFSDSHSLNKAFNQWALKNHPDKVSPIEKVKADAKFKEVANLRDRFKNLKRWN